MDPGGLTSRWARKHKEGAACACKLQKRAELPLQLATSCVVEYVYVDDTYTGMQIRISDQKIQRILKV